MLPEGAEVSAALRSGPATGGAAGGSAGSEAPLGEPQPEPPLLCRLRNVVCVPFDAEGDFSVLAERACALCLLPADGHAARVVAEVRGRNPCC